VIPIFLGMWWFPPPMSICQTITRTWICTCSIFFLTECEKCLLVLDYTKILLEDSWYHGIIFYFVCHSYSLLALILFRWSDAIFEFSVVGVGGHCFSIWIVCFILLASTSFTNLLVLMCFYFSCLKYSFRCQLLLKL
jgi:hypothetical protein